MVKNVGDILTARSAALSGASAGPSSGEDCAGASHVERSWMVLCTKSRQEKVVAEYLASRDLEHFLPLVNRVTITRGRKFTSRVPLFPGYVFLQGTQADRFGALDTGRVFQVLPVRLQSRFEHELAQIRHAVEHQADLELYPFAVEGRRCRVTGGPMTGLEGVVCRRTRHNRLVLHIDVLGRGAALEIDLDLLEPVEDAVHPTPGTVDTRVRA